MIPYRTAGVDKKRARRSHPGGATGLAALLLSRLNPAATTEVSHEMALTLSDVKRIAHLARIEVTDAEAGQALGQLNDIFRLIEQLQSVDTSGIEPMSHPLGGSQRLREDVASSTENREANMRNAPSQLDGLFLVPKVIE
jgi:aspartyl-tRNA(Asn)/glutamyl-tRNA(Gln) amidotransferase subunit C